MSNQYRVSWQVDAEAETPERAAKQVAQTYFLRKIAEGRPMTACVFIVESGVAGPAPKTVVVDLSTMAHNKSTTELRALYAPEGHPIFTVNHWQGWAGCGRTMLGYWDWLADQVESARVNGVEEGDDD